MNVWMMMEHLRAGDYQELDHHFNALQQKWELGEIDDLALQEAYPFGDTARVDLIAPTQAWVQEYPASYAAHHALAQLLLRVAWQARGVAPSSQTVARRFEEMQKYFDQAAAHIEIALRLTALPVLTLRLWSQIDAAGNYPDQGADHSIMFDALLTKSAVLCGHRFWRLNPKWGGDEDGLDSFMTEIRNWDWSEAQRNYLEENYLSEKADIERCQGNSGSAVTKMEQALKIRRSASSLQSLGEIHGHCRKEHAAAARYFAESAELSPSYSTFYYLGCALDEIGQKEQAAIAFEKALALGHGDAVSFLAYYVLDQTPSTKLFQQYETWFATGAAQFSSIAMGACADVHFHGNSIYPQDYKKWIQNSKMAAEWGSGSSMYNLALAFRNGRFGAVEDLPQAFHYAKSAAELDYESAYEMLGRMYYYGRGTAVDHEAALPYLVAGAELNDMQAIATLIRALWFGKGAQVDRVSAREWLTQLKTIDKAEYEMIREEILGLWGWAKSLLAQCLQVKGQT